MCDRHQVLGNDLADTGLGALYGFERKAAQELVYQI
jgi:hypothetical protein